MKIVQEEVKCDEFTVLWGDELKQFKFHVDTLQSQYSQIRLLKQNLPNYTLVLPKIIRASAQMKFKAHIGILLK